MTRVWHERVHASERICVHSFLCLGGDLWEIMWQRLLWNKMSSQNNPYNISRSSYATLRTIPRSQTCAYAACFHNFACPSAWSAKYKISAAAAMIHLAFSQPATDALISLHFWIRVSVGFRMSRRAAIVGGLPSSILRQRRTLPRTWLASPSCTSES